MPLISPLMPVPLLLLVVYSVLLTKRLLTDRPWPPQVLQLLGISDARYFHRPEMSFPSPITEASKSTEGKGAASCTSTSQRTSTFASLEPPSRKSRNPFIIQLALVSPGWTRAVNTTALRCCTVTRLIRWTFTIIKKISVGLVRQPTILFVSVDKRFS